MDRLEALGSQLSQITLYDIKSYYNQAKNMVLNVSEMEAKVREATNDEPWGASSTLMQEIAQGTFNFQQFNEIMPCIYSRFMEKEARQWREIYKSLQLLEYIIKHGSERVVDDARSHLSTIKMLRNFHYIDDKGKDQGINVRNRASEISTLLSDLDKIRSERRKAKANRTKYVGTGNDGGFIGGYGSYGSDSGWGYGGGSGSGDHYNGGGGGSSGFRDDVGRKGYEEYDAGDDEERPTSRPSNINSLRSPTSPTSPAPRSSNSRQSRAPETKEKEKAKPVVVDDLLGDWGDDSGFEGGSTALSIGKDKALPALATSGTNDDDFDDFQSAPISPPAAPLAFSQTPVSTVTLPQANPTNSKPNVFEFLNQTQAPAAPVLTRPQTQQQMPLQPQFSPQQATLQSQQARPNYYGGATGGNLGSNTISPMRASFPGGAGTGSPSRPSPTPASMSGHTASKPSSSNFDDLWSLGLGASGKTAPATAGGASIGPNKSIKDLEREKAQAGIWGGSQSRGGNGPVNASGPGSFGSFGGAGASGGAGDDLLL